NDRQLLRAVLDGLPRRPREPLQTVLEQYLHDDLPPCERLDADELVGVLQLARWFGDAEIPWISEVEPRLAWESVLAPLRRLVERGFVGRTDLLAALGEFVTGVEESELMIYGAGGCGKSTVIAHLLLDLAANGVPLAYVNYDRGWLIDGGSWAVFDE